MAGILRTDTIQNSNTSTIITQTNSTTLTIGTTGQTVALASGASQSGFGRAGSVNWDTTPKTSSPVTAVSGNGYFINTTAGAITINLPSTPAAGDIVAIADYANTSATNNITVGRNGSNINGVAVNGTISVNGQVYTLVYVDSTQGWKTVDQTYNQINTALYVAATGGTVTTCGDYKIHTFTGPGTFTVSCAGNVGGSDSVEYSVVAGGGSGGKGDNLHGGGGGGGGGFRFNSPSLAPLSYPAKPLSAPASLPVSATAYPITVGAGGSGATSPYSNNGNSSIFSTITSAGGGGGGGGISGPCNVGKNGGSGGGAGVDGIPAGRNGSGNTPPVNPPQGNNGALSAPNPSGGYAGAGGGGAAITVGNAITGGPGNAYGGPGGEGAGLPNAFGTSGQSSGGFYYFSGGGGGASRSCVPSNAPGGLGGGGASSPTGVAGTTNTGGGGGGALNNVAAGSGGSGIVVIRYKYQ
jgi:hypothetical protein